MLKRLLHVGGVLLLLSLVVVLIAQAQQAQQVISLQDAGGRGYVRLEGKGGYLGDKVTIINISSYDLIVTARKGDILLNEKAPSEQNLVITRDLRQRLRPGESAKGIFTACIDAERGSPSSGAVLDIATFNVAALGAAGSQLARLLEVIDSKGLWESSDAQDAIWNITDNKSVTGRPRDLLREAGVDPDARKDFPHWSSWSGKGDGRTGVAYIDGVPTLTEWGLIALGVLLAGGMGFMLYRRRPALRPAAP